MIKINADQIKNKLGFPYYLIVGSDPYLQYSTKKFLLSAFRQAGFDEQITFAIDNQTDWMPIYDSCQALSLFSSKTTIILDFFDNLLNAAITSKLNTLCEILMPDVALMIAINKLTKAQENSAWYQALSDKLVVVSCITPDISALPQWIKQYLQQSEIAVESASIELLCYYYEGNLLALTQTIDQLKLLYPGHGITYAQVEQHIYDSAVFTPYHWIDAMLLHKSKRAIHILQQLKVNELEPLILLRVVQKELILLINLKKWSVEADFKQAFDHYKVWQNRRQIYTNYLMQFEIIGLYAILAELTEIEVSLKTDYDLAIWDKLAAFTLKFMGLTQC